jgi:flagellar protein FliS
MSLRAFKAYGTTSLETEIGAASPHRLIAMLYEGALKAIARARVHMEKSEVPEKCASITRALAIIDQGLAASVDENAGGDLGNNLRSLYDYMVRRLAMANAKNDPAILDEVSRLLGDLASAWAQIQGQVEGHPDTGTSPP